MAASVKTDAFSLNGISSAVQDIVNEQKAQASQAKADPPLPTLDRLGATLQPDTDIQRIANEWFVAFSSAIAANDVPVIISLFLGDGWWRDFLALTWEFRTFHGVQKISKFLEDQLPIFKPANLKPPREVSLKQPYPDLAWIQAFFDFETEIGIGSGVFRLVPTADGTWKAWTVYTNLEDLKGFPEHIGPNREFLPNHGKWKDQREKERAFADHDPTVLIVGAGQSGLDVAARLKYLGVDALVVERQDRIGNQWRGRYEALCLHDPIWYDHMPYLPFPPTWPVYTPALKLADWLEYYAEAMELNVWLSSTVEKIRSAPNDKWYVAVRKPDGSERTFHVDHVVLALGLGGGVPKMLTFPGQEEFEGQITHSTAHKSARDHLGKKVFIVGAATSAHDLASDYVEHGVDVTIYQTSPTYIMSTKEGMPRMFEDTFWEGGPPTDIADRVFHSMPHPMLKQIHKRVATEIAQADRDTLEGLRKVGFKLGWGVDGSGFFYMALTRGGGYYLDVGASKKIIDGKIKLKSDSKIERLTKKGVVFQDGSEIEADVIVLATGFAGVQSVIDELMGKELASKVHPIWDLNEEAELRGAWRYIGLPNFWSMNGNLAMCRFHSKHIALQIKAIQEGLYGKRYAP